MDTQQDSEAPTKTTQFQFNLKEKPMITNLSGQVSEFFLEEEQPAIKTQKIETKRFPACFTKTGLKTTVSYDEGS